MPADPAVGVQPLYCVAICSKKMQRGKLHNILFCAYRRADVSHLPAAGERIFRRVPYSQSYGELNSWPFSYGLLIGRYLAERGFCWNRSDRRKILIMRDLFSTF